MKLSQEEKIEIIRKVKAGEMSVRQVVNEYGLPRSTVYSFLARPPVERKEKPYTPSPNKAVKIERKNEGISYDDYQNMSKEELINELILAKINEERAKKGYEVKGVGANKEFNPINNKNSK